MADEKKAVDVQAAAPETKPVVSSEDYEARIATLEAEKAKAIEEAANYKLGMLKAKGKLPTEELDEDDRIKLLVKEEVSKAKIATLDSEKESLLAKALKENKDLKLALSGKNTSPVSVGTHTEAPSVQDTSVTPEQLAAFKARGWTDKDITRYKKNFAKNSR